MIVQLNCFYPLKGISEESRQIFSSTVLCNILQCLVKNTGVRGGDHRREQYWEENVQFSRSLPRIITRLITNMQCRHVMMSSQTSFHRGKVWFSPPEKKGSFLLITKCKFSSHNQSIFRLIRQVNYRFVCYLAFVHVLTFFHYMWQLTNVSLVLITDLLEYHE